MQGGELWKGLEACGALQVLGSNPDASVTLHENDVQAMMVGELFVLAEKSQKDSKKPSGQGRFLQWYFFLVAAFWMYFRSPPPQLSSSLTSCMCLTSYHARCQPSRRCPSIPCCQRPLLVSCEMQGLLLWEAPQQHATDAETDAR